jgi:hypothetical protein
VGQELMPKGSASINNYLEAFDVSVLSRDFVCGTRTTMSQFFSPRRYIPVSFGHLLL